MRWCFGTQVTSLKTCLYVACSYGSHKTQHMKRNLLLVYFALNGDHFVLVNGFNNTTGQHKIDYI